MTSKEALIKLVDKTGIINDTCASLKDCIKGCKCRFNEPKKECDDYNLVMTIKKDLKRLEQLEKAVDILKKKNVDLIELCFSYSLTEYNIVVKNTGYNELTQEEYNLLRKVFKNES